MCRFAAWFPAGWQVVSQVMLKGVKCLSGNAMTSQSSQGWADLRVHFIMKCGANISFGPVSFFLEPWH